VITEEEKERIARETAQRGIRLCEEAIAKAEKYERLKDNPDWKGFLDDLKTLASLHEKEIEWARSMLVDAPHTGYLKMNDQGRQEYVSSRDDWTHFIVRHHIQKTECENWVKEPEHLLTLAGLSREKLPSLKEKAKEAFPVSGLPSENGKP